MVQIESDELLDNLSLLLKISQEFKLNEMSKAYEDIIRLIKSMETEVIRKEVDSDNIFYYRIYESPMD